MDAVNTGRFLQSLRKEQNLTQKDISKLCGVSVQAVSKWENGDNMPDIEYLNRLSILYRVSINELIDGERSTMSDDTEKKKTIWSLTFSVFVFIAYLLPFFSGSYTFSAGELTQFEGFPGFDDSLVPDVFGNITIDYTLQGYEYLFNSSDYFNFFLPMAWIVAAILISHLVIRLYTLSGFMKKTKGLTLYLIGSSFIALIISIGLIINEGFHTGPQFIIVMGVFLNLMLMYDEPSFKEFKKTLRRKHFEESYEPLNTQSHGGPMIVLARILTGVLFLFNILMAAFAVYVFIFEGEPFINSVVLGFFVFFLPASFLFFALINFGKENTPIHLMIATVASSVFLIAPLSTTERPFSHMSQVLVFGIYGAIVTMLLTLTVLAYKKESGNSNQSYV
ncbi:MAG: helix-turn-helix domain-containing protein [Bacillota bacterium]